MSDGSLMQERGNGGYRSVGMVSGLYSLGEWVLP